MFYFFQENKLSFFFLHTNPSFYPLLSSHPLYLPAHPRPHPRLR